MSGRRNESSYILISHMIYRLARVFHELLNATLFTFDVSIYYTCKALPLCISKSILGILVWRTTRGLQGQRPKQTRVGRPKRSAKIEFRVFNIVTKTQYTQ